MKFSAIIPLYNKAAYIETAVASVQAQPGDGIGEIIVVDDGSTDDGAGVVERMARSDPRICLIRQENAGECAARNRGAAEAHFPFLLFLDADDEWTSEFVPAIEGLIARYPEAGVFATSYVRKWPDGAMHHPDFAHVPTGKEGGELDLRSYLRCAARGWSPVCSSAVCIRATMLRAVGGFPEGVSHGGDRILWMRLALATRMAWLPTVGAVYHQHRAANSVESWVLHKPHDVLEELVSLRGRPDIDGETCAILDELIKLEWRYDINYHIKHNLRLEAARIIFQKSKDFGILYFKKEMVKLLLPNRVFERIYKMMRASGQ